MALDPSEIEKMAVLARLKIDKSKASEYAENLSNILNFVEQMQAVNTDNIEPLAHPLDPTQRHREDTVTETDNRTQFQSIAPQTEDGLYLVPQVID